ncbi:MAG: hypothetical protein QM811_26735 [Pirellulales bacterium]
MTAKMTPATNKNDNETGMYGRRNSTPAPPIAWPMFAPANISPLAVPRSCDFSVVTASALIATSIVAPKTLWTKMIAVNNGNLVVKSTPVAPSNAKAMPA